MQHAWCSLANDKIKMIKQGLKLDFIAFITKNVTYGQFKLSIRAPMGNVALNLRHDSASKYMHIIQLKSILAFLLK